MTAVSTTEPTVKINIVQMTTFVTLEKVLVCFLLFIAFILKLDSLAIVYNLLCFCSSYEVNFFILKIKIFKNVFFKTVVQTEKL